MFRITREDASSVFGYITIGLMMGQVGPLLSAASVDLGVDSSMIGNTIAIYYGTSILGILLGFFVIKRIGKAPFLLAGTLMMTIAYALGTFVNSPVALLVLTVFTGFGLGIYQIGINSLAVDRSSVYPLAKQAGRLTFLQFFFGMGAVTSPLLVDLSHQQFHNWRISYLLVLLLGLLVMLILLIRDLKHQTLTAGDQDRAMHPVDPSEKTAVQPIHWGRLLILLLLVAGIYTGLETSMFNWISYYWDQRYVPGALLTGAKASSVFWLVFSLSRAFMGQLVARMGAWNALVTFAVLILILVLLWSICLPVWWVMLGIIVLIALLMGCIFPTTMVIISRQQEGDSSSILSVFFVLTTAVASVVPIGIGMITKRWDVGAFPWTLAGIAACFLIMLLYARMVKGQGLENS